MAEEEATVNPQTAQKPPKAPEKEEKSAGNQAGEEQKKLSGVQKAAVLLISLGVEKAAEVLKNLDEREVEELTIAIADMENIESEMVNKVRDEYHELIISKEFMLEGGADYARNLLTTSMGKEKADKLMKKHEESLQEDAFRLFQSSEKQQVVQFLKNEQPQVSAVILAHLEVGKAAEILSALPDDLQADVAYRLANMSNVSNEMVEELKEIIMDEMNSGYEEIDDILKGSSAVASILNQSSIATERQVLENITEFDPELAEEIKQQMFLFEDIIELEDLTLQSIIAKLDNDDMVKGLKGVDSDLKDKFVSNMSQRAGEILLDDLEAMGPLHVKQVEEAQQNILHTIRKLQAEGEISIRKNEAENIIE